MAVRAGLGEREREREREQKKKWILACAACPGRPWGFSRWWLGKRDESTNPGACELHPQLLERQRIQCGTCRNAITPTPASNSSSFQNNVWQRTRTMRPQKIGTVLQHWPKTTQPKAVNNTKIGHRLSANLLKTHTHTGIHVRSFLFRQLGRTKNRICGCVTNWVVTLGTHVLERTSEVCARLVVSHGCLRTYVSVSIKQASQRTADVLLKWKERRATLWDSFWNFEILDFFVFCFSDDKQHCSEFKTFHLCHKHLVHSLVCFFPPPSRIVDVVCGRFVFLSVLSNNTIVEMLLFSSDESDKAQLHIQIFAICVPLVWFVQGPSTDFRKGWIGFTNIGSNKGK